MDTMKKILYSPYSTIVFVREQSEVWVYDEIRKRTMQRVKVSSSEEAVEIIKRLKADAPKEYICTILEEV